MIECGTMFYDADLCLTAHKSVEMTKRDAPPARAFSEEFQDVVQIYDK